MRWGYADALHALWLLMPLAALGFWLLRRRERRLARLLDPALWPVLLPGRSPRRARRRMWMTLTAGALLIVAMARPQWGFHWEEVKQRGLDIMVVLDTSKSMLAQDIKPDRLQQAKWGIRDLVRQLHGDRLGLVAFAGGSFLQCPLTSDYAAFLMTLDDLYAGIIPRGGTAIEQALRTAIDSFEPTDEADRAIVLITDGEDHEGAPLRLADELKREGIRVFAIGIGTLDGELIPEPAETGGRGFLKDRSGAVVKSALKEDTLQQLAAATGGGYVRSAPGDLGLERVFNESINRLKRDERESRMAKVFEDRYVWPAAAALLVLVLEGLVAHRERRMQEEAS